MGALKITSDGDTIDLGRIDQTDVVVNGLLHTLICDIYNINIKYYTKYITKYNIYNIYLFFFLLLEDTIVLTYVGGDINMKSKDTCKGQRWTAYMTFICDPFVTSVRFKCI